MSEKLTLKFEFVVHVEPDGDGFYAFCPAFKGLHVDGDTELEAIENARIAAGVRLRALLRNGEPVPMGVSCHDVTPEPFWKRVGNVFNPAMHQGHDSRVTAEVSVNH